MSSEPHTTVGELRRLLAELGDPWQVDPNLPDDDPLPDPPRGAEPPQETAGAQAAPTDLRAMLAETPPANPHLRTRWAEEGLLADDGAADPS
jgi:hypothetical protein